MPPKNQESKSVKEESGDAGDVIKKLEKTAKQFNYIGIFKLSQLKNLFLKSPGTSRKFTKNLSLIIQSGHNITAVFISNSTFESFTCKTPFKKNQNSLSNRHTFLRFVKKHSQFKTVINNEIRKISGTCANVFRSGICKKLVLLYIILRYQNKTSHYIIELLKKSTLLEINSIIKKSVL